MSDPLKRPADNLRDILVIGASAGGLDPLTRLVSDLPADLPAAVFVVVHIPPAALSLLPEILSRAGPLPAAHAADGELILPGRIYVAPPDRHLLIEPGLPGEPGRVRLSGGPRENFVRPAVDPLFRSAAAAYGARVVAVVLSGTLRDGTAGLWDATRQGGLAVVQDPGEAAYASMPHAAMDQVPVDYVVSAAEIGALLVRLVGKGAREESGEEPAGEEPAGKGDAMAAQDRGRGGEASREAIADGRPGSGVVGRDLAEQVSGRRNETVSVYVCPECGGSLWQVNAGRMMLFRCHVGHIYSDQNLLAGYTEDTERALWTAIRTLRDKANLIRQLAKTAATQDTPQEAAWYQQRAQLDEDHAAQIERMLGAAEAVSRRVPPDERAERETPDYDAR